MQSLRVGATQNGHKRTATVVVPDGVDTGTAAHDCVVAITAAFQPAEVEWIEGASPDLAKLIVSSLTVRVPAEDPEAKRKTREHKPKTTAPSNWTER